MELIGNHRKENFEFVIEYRHKKFDLTKRPRECDRSAILEAKDYSDSPKPSPCSVSSTSSIPDINSCFSDFSVEVGILGDTSPSKRIKLDESFYNDSGICMTPIKEEILSDTASTISETSSSSSSAGARRFTSTPIGAVTLVPHISDETIRDVCKYHSNMARKFPKKERTTKDQERRNKNTIACRMSRRVKKLEHIAIDEQYKVLKKQHLSIAEESVRAAVYLTELIKMGAVEMGESNIEELKKQLKTAGSTTAPTGIPFRSSFSIESLTGERKEAISSR